MKIQVTGPEPKGYHYYISFRDASLPGDQFVEVDAYSSREALDAFERAAIESGVHPSVINVGRAQ